MMYGLSHVKEELLANKLSQVLALSPCFIINTESPKVPADNIFEYKFLDITSGIYEVSHIMKNHNGISLKTMMHYDQNAITGRFQEFDDDFGFWEEERVTENIPIENIKTPISFFFGENDDLC